MTYDEIMEEIKSGLTGDTKVDMKYLMTQMDKYKEHELSQEIIRACGRMIASIMPEDAKEEFNNPEIRKLFKEYAEKQLVIR